MRNLFQHVRIAVWLLLMLVMIVIGSLVSGSCGLRSVFAVV